MYALAARDLYNGTSSNIEPASLLSAVLTGPAEITLTFRNTTDTYTWKPGGEKSFVLEGTTVKVNSVSLTGNKLKLSLSGGPAGATGISHTGRAFPTDATQYATYLADPMVTNARGVGALNFHNFPFGSATIASGSPAAVRTEAHPSTQRAIVVQSRGSIAVLISRAGHSTGALSSIDGRFVKLPLKGNAGRGICRAMTR